LEAIDNDLVWLHGEVKTPPFSEQARRTAGFLLRKVQGGTMLPMPSSRPMPVIGAGCHELRVQDAAKGVTWRIVYRIDDDAVVIGEVFAKKRRQTPSNVIAACKRRFRLYDESQ
jgi:phage-related protein